MVPALIFKLPPPLLKFPAGPTPRESILLARLELAKRLLIETHWPTERVAE